MKMPDEVYQPAEDTFLLLDYLNQLEPDGQLLEVGTGSGLIAVKMAENGWQVTASDIHQESVKEAEELAVEKDVEVHFISSDLFGNISGEYDLVVFNPPYLPGGDDVEGRTWKGGEKGVEITERFLEQVRDYLADGGRAVFVASSLSKIEGLEDCRKIRSTELWFETLYLMEFK